LELIASHSEEVLTAALDLVRTELIAIRAAREDLSV
jgi:hypothetical protein